MATIQSARPMATTIQVQGCLHTLEWVPLGLGCLHRMDRECHQGQGWDLLSQVWVLVCLSNLEWVHHTRIQLQQCLPSQEWVLLSNLGDHLPQEWDLLSQEWVLLSL